MDTLINIFSLICICLNLALYSSNFFFAKLPKNGWDNNHPSHSYFGYLYNHWSLLKWLILGNYGALRTKKLLELPFLSSKVPTRTHLMLRKDLLQEGWLEISCKNTSPAQFIMRIFPFFWIPCIILIMHIMEKPYDIYIYLVPSMKTITELY